MKKKDMNEPKELSEELREYKRRGELPLLAEAIEALKLLRARGGTMVLILSDDGGDGEHVDFIRSPLVDQLVEIETPEGSLIQRCDERLGQCIAAATAQHKPATWTLGLSITVPGNNQVYINTDDNAQPKTKIPHANVKGKLRTVDLNAPYNLEEAPKRQPQLPGVNGQRLVRKYLK